MGYFSLKNRTFSQKIFIGVAIISGIGALFNPGTLFTGLLFLWAGTAPNDEKNKNKENIYEDILDYDEEEK